MLPFFRSILRVGYPKEPTAQLWQATTALNKQNLSELIQVIAVNSKLQLSLNLSSHQLTDAKLARLKINLPSPGLLSDREPCRRSELGPQ